MLRLKDWLSRHLGKDTVDSASDRDMAVKLAVAALLVEILRADYATTAAERGQVLDSMGSLLGLERRACEELLERAEASIDEAHDLYQFTSEINRSWSAEDKLRLVVQLWQVAQADDTVHKYEEHLIRRIADLLHVSHREFIVAKLRSAGRA